MDKSRMLGTSSPKKAPIMSSPAATAKHVVEQGMDLHKVEAATLLFEGTAREAARQFPANVNVAAAVALAVR